jgi:hypothetical protein
LRTQGDVLNAVEQSPRASVRRISLATGVPRMQVWRILHHDGLCPYHLQRVQHLLPNDNEQRLQFCNRLQTNWQSLDNILFTDETLFTRDGINNTRHSHTWANENPHAVVECNSTYNYPTLFLLDSHELHPGISYTLPAISDLPDTQEA